MTSINERIKLIMQRERIPAKTVANWLNFGESRASQKFKDGVWDSLAELKILSEKTGYELHWIISGTGPEKATELSVVEEPPLKFNSHELSSIVDLLKVELEDLRRSRDLILTAKDQTIRIMEKRIEELERQLSLIKP